MPWRESREWAAQPQAGSDREFAHAFLLTSNGDEQQVTVEFATGHGGGSVSEARRYVSQYLDAERPPRRIIVDREGGHSTREE